MNLWIVLFSFLAFPPDAPQIQLPDAFVAAPRLGAPALTADSPMRYRGIEALLAKFEAEARATTE